MLRNPRYVLSRSPPAATVGPRDHLKQVAVDLFEVDAAPAVVVVDLALLRLAGISTLCPLWGISGDQLLINQ
jgi:hypothetical protein